MKQLIMTVCGLTLLGAALVFAGAPPAGARAALQGNWVATRAETNGVASPGVVGHRLTLSGDRFEISSRDGKVLYAGTVRTDPDATPATIDFVHAQGALRGRVWKGIYALNGDVLTECDNAADLTKDRPAAFETKPGSGHVLITFVRAK
jgi:uncharacterized protein (TIGR03067 family)